MTQKQRKIYHNPLLSLIATDAERLGFEPVIGRKYKEKKLQVSVLDWLKYLESPDHLLRNREHNPRKKTKEEIRKDLRKIEKFWKVAHARAIAREGFKDPRINNVEITRRTHEQAGLGISHQEIRLMRLSWNVENESYRDRMAQIDVSVREHIQENPIVPISDIIHALKLPRYKILEIMKGLGIDIKNRGKNIAEEEQRLRREFLDERRIRYDPKYRIRCSIPEMEKEIEHRENRYGCTVKNVRMIYIKMKKFEDNVKILDAHCVDWRDDERELWKLLNNNSEALKKLLELFDSVGASPELHYVLLGGIRNRLKFYESDREYYAELRQAVVENNFVRLMRHAKQIAGHTTKLRCLSQLGEYFDAATTVATIVISECKQREKNPAFVLTLMAAAISLEIKKRTIEFVRIRSTEELVESQGNDWKKRTVE